MGALGHEVVLVYVAAIFVLAALYGMHRMRVREAPPVEEQADYVPMSRTSSAVLEMDPRVEEAEAGLAEDDQTVSPAAS